jgi:transcriptional regulator of acetoin/glycerol metabolism
VLEANHFGFDSPHQTQPAYNANWTLEEIESFHIKSTLSAENGNVEKTAKRLGIAKSTLYQKLKALNLT